jgi:hypothetical protein
MSNSGGVVNALFGGWALTGIFRWNSGFPINGDGTTAAGGGTNRPFSFRRWGTNWQVSSGMVNLTGLETSPSKDVNGEPNLFSNPQAAYLSTDPFPCEPEIGTCCNPHTLRSIWGFTSRLRSRTRPIHYFPLGAFNVTNTSVSRPPSGAGFGFHLIRSYRRQRAGDCLIGYQTSQNETRRARCSLP